MRGIAMLMRRSRNSYMRAPRSVTLQPIARPARILNEAIALRDLVTSGFWPVILVRSPIAASITFLSDRLAHAHVHRDLGDARDLHGILDPEVLLQAADD